MNKELKALEDIILYLNASEPKGLYCKNIEIIKNALKDYERLLKMRKTAEWADEKLQTKKKLKALEIIKRKKVNVADELFVLDKATNKWVFDTYEWYLKSVVMIPNKYHLTQEEYNLLKEVLL